PSAFDHLRKIVSMSVGPEYRRAGSAGMAQVADYAASQLSGFTVVRVDTPFSRYVVDYADPPPLTRTDDGGVFKSESASNPKPHAASAECPLKADADVTPGDCGWVPFNDASPEWRNDPFSDLATQVGNIVAQGGVGAVVQGDVSRDLVYAISL